MKATDESNAKLDSSETELERAEFIARLHSLIPERGENAFARRAGISPSGLRGALKSGNPGREMLLAIARAARVRVQWLATGEGEKEHREPSADHADAPDGARTPAQSRTIEEEDVRIFFGVVSAVQRLGGLIPEPHKAEIAVRMRDALAVMARDQDHQARLDQDDLDQLARIARKLL